MMVASFVILNSHCVISITKIRSKDEFLADYKAFKCEDNSCYVCGSDSSSSAEQ